MDGRERWPSSWSGSGVAVRPRPSGRSRRTCSVPSRDARRLVVFHLRILSYVVELGCRPVVGAEHRVLVVPSPDVVMVAQREMTPGFWGLALEQDREILPLHRRGRFYPQKT